MKNLTRKASVTDHEKPLSVGAGADSFDAIELYDRPTLTLEEIRRIYVTRFPQRPREEQLDEDDFDDPANDEEFAEHVIDRLKLQREQVGMNFNVFLNSNFYEISNIKIEFSLLKHTYLTARSYIVQNSAF